MKTRTLAGTASALLVLAVVATAVAQVAPDDPPTVQEAGDAEPGTSTTETDAGADDPDAATAAEPDAAAATEPDATPEPDGREEVDAAPAEATAMPEAGTTATSETDVSRVVQRRREAALVGGWVQSTRDDAAARFVVDDLRLAATGEWLRRQSSVDAQAGMTDPPEESSGTWFTEEGDLVLVARGSAVDEVLRAAYQIDDRSETLILELSGGTVSYYRYR